MFKQTIGRKTLNRMEYDMFLIISTYTHTIIRDLYESDLTVSSIFEIADFYTDYAERLRTIARGERNGFLLDKLQDKPRPSEEVVNA